MKSRESSVRCLAVALLVLYLVCADCQVTVKTRRPVSGQPDAAPRETNHEVYEHQIYPNGAEDAETGHAEVAPDPLEPSMLRQDDVEYAPGVDKLLEEYEELDRLNEQKHRQEQQQHDEYQPGYEWQQDADDALYEDGREYENDMGIDMDMDMDMHHHQYHDKEDYYRPEQEEPPHWPHDDEQGVVCLQEFKRQVLSTPAAAGAGAAALNGATFQSSFRCCHHDYDSESCQVMGAADGDGDVHDEGHKQRVLDMVRPYDTAALCTWQIVAGSCPAHHPEHCSPALLNCTITTHAQKCGCPAGNLMFSAHGFTKALTEARSCDQRYPAHDTWRRRGDYGAKPFNVSAYVFADDYVQLVADDYKKIKGEVEFVLATYPQGGDELVMKQLISGQGELKPRASNKTRRHHNKPPVSHGDKLPSDGDKKFPWNYDNRDDRDKLVRSIDKMVKRRDEMLRDEMHRDEEEYYSRDHLTAPGHRDKMLRRDVYEEQEFYARDHLTAPGDREMTHPPGGGRRGSRMPPKAAGKDKQEAKGSQGQSPFTVLDTVPRKEKPEPADEKHAGAHDSTKGPQHQKFDQKFDSSKKMDGKGRKEPGTSDPGNKEAKQGQSESPFLLLDKVPRQEKPVKRPLQPHDNKDGQDDKKEPISSDKNDDQGPKTSDEIFFPVSSDKSNNQAENKLDASQKVGGQEGTTVGASEKLDGQGEQKPGAVDGQRDANDASSGATEKPDINEAAPAPAPQQDDIKVDPSSVPEKPDPSAATDGQADKNVHARNGLRRKTIESVKASILSAPHRRRRYDDASTLSGPPRRRYDPSRYEVPFVRGGQLKIKLSNDWHY